MTTAAQAMNEGTKATAVGSRLDRTVRRPRWLPVPKDFGTDADQCRQMGLQVGDTIVGREHHWNGRDWHEARLTLLWLGEELAVWRSQERTSQGRGWTEPEETCQWTLEDRRWRWTPNAKLTGKAGTPGLSG